MNSGLPARSLIQISSLGFAGPVFFVDPNKYGGTLNSKITVGLMGLDFDCTFGKHMKPFANTQVNKTRNTHQKQERREIVWVRILIWRHVHVSQFAVCFAFCWSPTTSSRLCNADLKKIRSSEFSIMYGTPSSPIVVDPGCG